MVEQLQTADISGAFLGTTATDTGWEQAAKIEDALLAMVLLLVELLSELLMIVNTISL